MIMRKCFHSFVKMMILLGVVKQAIRCTRSFSLRNIAIHQPQPMLFHANHRFSRTATTTTTTTTRLFYTPFPENLYREWTLEQDRLLWSKRNQLPSELAVLLGRGVRGVEKRIEKLKDVDSPAYQRLFVGENSEESDVQEEKQTHKKLIPSGEVLRRIEWDYQLDEKDFAIMHYDRVEDTLVTSPLTAPNTNINSGETSLIKALPEHRIMAILYKQRVVWDRRNNRKHDAFFGSPGILEIAETYEAWKDGKDTQRKEQEMLRVAWQQRWTELLQSESENRKLVHLTEDLLADSDDTHAPASPNNQNHDDESTITLTNDQQQRLDTYIHNVFEIFRTIETSDDDAAKNNILVSLFDELSEWIASPCWSTIEYDDVEDEGGSEADLLRSTLLRKLSSTMDKLEGKNTKESPKQQQQQQQQQQQSKRQIAQQQNERNQNIKQLLNDDDIEETFVRGSGAGGQKINKTSNRVVLVHIPTGVRVECKDTRSLQQNRKIGRKRLLEKLDNYYHGSNSKEQQKTKKAQSKKKKTKSKNKARLAAKQEAKRQKKAMQLAKQKEEEEEFW